VRHIDGETNARHLRSYCNFDVIILLNRVIVRELCIYADVKRFRGLIYTCDDFGPERISSCVVNDDGKTGIVRCLCGYAGYECSNNSGDKHYAFSNLHVVWGVVFGLGGKLELRHCADSLAAPK